MMKNILIVDDEESVLNLLKSILEKNNYEVIVSKNGQDGLFVAHENKPDLIIVDYSMPQMDGLTFMKECKASKFLKDIPIIILTSNDDAEFNFLKAGAADFMAKPIKSEDLLQKIMKVFTKKNKGFFGFFK